MVLILDSGQIDSPAKVALLISLVVLCAFFGYLRDLSLKRAAREKQLPPADSQD
jgi:hypothetical protein